jgi:signal transduction histidine kinase
MVEKFKSQNPPLFVEISANPKMVNKYYYGDSKLLHEVRYYPLIQLFIIGLFIIITINAISQRNKSTQNQVWAGMAKETAHQLGTPISSLEAWVEMLKDQKENEKIANEISKDVQRLKLVSDRFGKIGSTPQLEPHDLLKQVEEMVTYIRKRAPETVSFTIDTGGGSSFIAPINPPLFDWVMENLLKNALDAVEGKGQIKIQLHKSEKRILIDVSDNGKGISVRNISLVFKPGYSTKKRGWGLGLSLSKRIMEQYHRGELYVKQSELGKGSTFRIVLTSA